MHRLIRLAIAAVVFTVPFLSVRAGEPTIEQRFVAIRVENAGGGLQGGSGTILQSREGTALVLTNAHVTTSEPKSIMATTSGPLGYYSLTHSYMGRLLRADAKYDLAAFVIQDPGGITPVRLAAKQARHGIAFGIGSTYDDVPIRREGRMLALELVDGYIYGFASFPGDSGGGLWSPDYRLSGVVWGRKDAVSCVVGVDDIRKFLAEPDVTKWFPDATNY